MNSGAFTAAQQPGAASSPTGNSAVSSAASSQILYVAHTQTIGTYVVDPASGSITQIGSDVTVQNTASPGAGPLNVTVSPNDRFLFVNLYDTSGNPFLGIFATDGHGVPQLPAIQTVKLAPFEQFSFDPNGRWAYSLIQTTDESTQMTSAVIHQWSIDPATGKLTETGMQVSDPPAQFSNYAIGSVVLGGTVLLSSSDRSIDGFDDVGYLSHSIDPETGALGPATKFFGFSWQWGEVARIALSSQYVAKFFDGMGPDDTSICVAPMQTSTAAPGNCFGLADEQNNGDGLMQFDPSGNFLFVHDVITSRIRVLQLDAHNNLLRDTGSFIPVTTGEQVTFSPDDSLVYAVPDADAHLHVFGFDKSSGALTPKGSPTALPLPFVLVSSARK
ncbi:MAG TPA: hypothetical protein VJT08_18705 [Terriglobales bacterium]|nr:hypothetical protein [Terriglobales bacterium]